MQKFTLYLVLLLVSLLFSFCTDDIIEDDNKVSVTILNENSLKGKLEDKITIPIELIGSVDQIKLLHNDQILESIQNPEGTINWEVSTLIFGIGKHQLKIEYTYEGLIKEKTFLINIFSNKKPKVKYAEISNRFNHDNKSFTQGLEFNGLSLYEGTGNPNNNGGTFIAEIDLETGKHIKKQVGDPSDFGEGITILNQKIFQLTWQQNKCYVYDLNSFEREKFFSYHGEGWGLTNNNDFFIMSDGTQTIYFRDINTFEIVKSIQVASDVSSVTNLNELEYCNGSIYANVWQNNVIVEIDPNNGAVISIIDCSNLISEVQNNIGENRPDVLNGIAYSPERRKFYLTGKYWPTLFEVDFKEYEQ